MDHPSHRPTVVKICRHGHGYAVSIPRPFMSRNHWQHGDLVTLVQIDGAVIVESITPHLVALAEGRRADHQATEEPTE